MINRVDLISLEELKELKQKNISLEVADFDEVCAIGNNIIKEESQVPEDEGREIYDYRVRCYYRTHFCRWENDEFELELLGKNDEVLYVFTFYVYNGHRRGYMDL